MNTKTGRRQFLKTSLAATLAVPFVTSLEEYALAAQEIHGLQAPPATPARQTLPLGKIGKVQISRLICGGNLISGYAHSRDLIYVSRLLKAYFTDQKIMETWDLCTQHGINTMIFNPEDRHALEVYRKYQARGSKIQCLAQLAPPKDNQADCIKEAVDAGVVGVVLVGNYGDAWTRDGSMGKIEEFLKLAKAEGVIAGVAGHELRTVQAVEKAGLEPDFYMKTLHADNYWSHRRPNQVKEVIDNYGVDNYWCRDPQGTIQFMQELERPWLAYKVLAAGAVLPRAGFQHAFENGADFCVVGVFDFQVAEDVAIARKVLQATENRERAWMA